MSLLLALLETDGNVTVTADRGQFAVAGQATTFRQSVPVGAAAYVVTLPPVAWRIAAGAAKATYGAAFPATRFVVRASVMAASYVLTLRAVATGAGLGVGRATYVVTFAPVGIGNANSVSVTTAAFLCSGKTAAARIIARANVRPFRYLTPAGQCVHHRKAGGVACRGVDLSPRRIHPPVACGGAGVRRRVARGWDSRRVAAASRASKGRDARWLPVRLAQVSRPLGVEG